jgi:hypothetical protein
MKEMSALLDVLHAGETKLWNRAGQIVYDYYEEVG